MKQANAIGSRRALPLTLVVIGSLVGLLAVFSIWAKRQLLETDSWVETSTELLAEAEIRDALAGFLVDELYTSVDVESEIAGVLPPRAAPLAGPIAGGVRQAADEIAKRALEQQAIQDLWEEANRDAHEILLRIVDGGGENVSTEDGVVTLDLSAILAQVAAQTGLPDSLVQKLPPQAAELEILRADELGAAQDGVDLLRTLVWVLTALTLGLYAVAIAISGARRRETLRAVGYSLIAVGAIVLIVRDLAGGALTDALASSTSSEPAVDATWAISTSMLAEAGGAGILYGIVVVFSAWLAGPTGAATGLRGALAPYLRRPTVAYAGLGVLLVLLFCWDPTPATERLIPSLLLIVLLVLGTEMLRRRTIAEFPERVTTFSAAGMAQTMASQTRESVARLTRARTERSEGEATSARLEALERIGRLRESGLLTEAEAEAEKARLLGSGPGTP